MLGGPIFCGHEMATRLYIILYFYEVALTYKFVKKKPNIKHEAAPLNQPLSNEN